MSQRTSISSQAPTEIEGGTVGRGEPEWTSESPTPTPPNDVELDIPPSSPSPSNHDREKPHTDGNLNLVTWDGDTDKENPRNWSTGYKSWITFQLGMLALAASMGSSIISPAGDTIAEYVGVSQEVSVLSISLYM